MRNRRRFFQITLIFVVLGGTVWLTLRRTDPFYKDKPLTFWLEGYDSGEFERPYSGPWLDAQEAVRQTGTNAIPTLLRMMRSRDSSLKLKLMGWLGEKYSDKLHLFPAGRRQFEAMRGFCSLGADASSAVPALIEIFKEEVHNQPYGSSAENIAEAFGGIGPAACSAVPFLLSWTTNTDAQLRRDAVRILGEIHASPEIVVPTLIKSLNDPDATVRWSAVDSLKAFGPAAKPAVPALLGSLQDKDKGVLEFVAPALEQIDPEAAAKAKLK